MSTLTETLLSLEQMLLDPSRRANSDSLASLLADDFVEFGSSGRRYSRSEVLEALRAEPATTSVIEDFAVRELGDHAALVTYRVVRASGASLRSSVWRRGGLGWVLVFHQGTRSH